MIHVKSNFPTAQSLIICMCICCKIKLISTCGCNICLFLYYRSLVVFSRCHSLLLPMCLVCWGTKLTLSPLFVIVSMFNVIISNPLMCLQISITSTLWIFFVIRKDRFVASHKQGRLEASRATAGGITLDVKLGRRDEAVTRQRSNEAILCVS